MSIFQFPSCPVRTSYWSCLHICTQCPVSCCISEPVWCVTVSVSPALPRWASQLPSCWQCCLLCRGVRGEGGELRNSLPLTLSPSSPTLSVSTRSSSQADGDCQARHKQSKYKLYCLVKSREFIAKYGKVCQSNWHLILLTKLTKVLLDQCRLLWQHSWSWI